jgi:hypothetical protein
VKEWQSYHELPSTGFWGPQSRSTVQKLGLSKLASKATTGAVDDPMGVHAARPRPLVPWSTVPVSTTASTKQVVSNTAPTTLSARTRRDAKVANRKLAGRQKMALERWTNLKQSRRTRSPRVKVPSCLGESAGVL